MPSEFVQTASENVYKHTSDAKELHTHAKRFLLVIQNLDYPEGDFDRNIYAEKATAQSVSISQPLIKDDFKLKSFLNYNFQR